MNDTHDGNFKYTSHYVSETMARLGPELTGQSDAVPPPAATIPTATPPPPPMSQADFYRAHFDDYSEKARSAAVEKFPDDTVAQDLAVSRVQQQMSAVIRHQEETYKADSDTILRAANGDLAKGVHPQTVDDLTAVSPDVKAAWDRVQVQQPEFAHQIATRLLTENAKGPNKDATEYGPGWSGVYKQLYPSDGSAPQINERQIHGMVASGALTYAGGKAAIGELNSDEDEKSMKSELFKAARQQLSHEDDTGLIKDPAGEQKFAAFQASALQTIQKLKSEGKTPYQIYDPASPDYVGKGISAFKRSDAQVNQDLIGANPCGPATAGGGFFSHLFEPGPDLSTPEKVREAYTNGKIDRGGAFDAIRKLQGIKPAATE